MMSIAKYILMSKQQNHVEMFLKAYFTAEANRSIMLQIQG
jgi:hypothetical protein